MRRLLFAFLLGGLLVGLLDAKEDATECGPNVAQCKDLNKCTPPSVKLTVPREVVLVLGITGCGKSTLTKFLSHDNDLRAVQRHKSILIEGSSIGDSVVSETTIPVLMKDKATGTNYFDCPGFEDTRGSCVEVNTTYYMKDIARHAKRVKVLLLTPHFGVLKGQDRAEFPTMLLNAATLLRIAPNSLKRSMALVVTKVQAYRWNKATKKFYPTPEDVVKKSIAAFLREDVAPFLADKIKTVADAVDGDAYRGAAQIVDSMLVNDNGDYSRIGIFRVPDKEGSLNSIPAMEDERKRLLDLVHHTLKFTDVQPSDFGFSVSDRTKLFAFTRSRALSDAVVAKMSALGTDLATSRGRLVYDASDIPGTADRLHVEMGKVQKIAEDLKNATSVRDFCDRLGEDFKNSPQQSRALEVADECRYLDVLQVVSDAPMVEGGVLSSQWAQSMTQAARDLSAREEWNRFLVSLYERLNKYDAQLSLRTKKYAPVSLANLSTFAEEVSNSLTLFTKLQHSASNLSDLNALLSRMNRAPQVQCGVVDGLLVVRGESVLLSEVAAEVRRCGANTVHSVDVYALNTFFVDASVRLPGVSLAVFAPRWEILGDAEITLDGSSGDPPARRPADLGDGERGRNGAPGKPGYPGGNFLGVGLEVDGAGKVYLNGGTGGGGQPGGNGGNGKRGGGHGGDGGDGGAGGHGGHPGIGFLVKLKASSGDMQMFANVGRVGAGGRGGLGGDHRPYVGTIHRQKRLAFLPILAAVAVVGTIGGVVYVANRPTIPPLPPPPQYNDGMRGEDGAVFLGQEQPMWPLQFPWRGAPARMKLYFRLNLDHPYHGETLRDFLHLATQDKTLERIQQAR